jgi:hypothetical protein
LTVKPVRGIDERAQGLENFLFRQDGGDMERPKVTRASRGIMKGLAEGLKDGTLE